MSTGYLLDTNVVSELIKARPNPDAVRWLGTAGECFLSVLTIGELTRGVLRLRDSDPTRAAQIGDWIQQLRMQYADRLLPVDLAVMDRWASLQTGRTLPVVDSLLAATALSRDLAVATRNTKDFADTGVALANPFVG